MSCPPWKDHILTGSTPQVTNLSYDSGKKATPFSCQFSLWIYVAVAITCLLDRSTSKRHPYA